MKLAAVAESIRHLVAALLDLSPGLSEPPLALRSRAHCAPSIGTLRPAPGAGLDSFPAAALADAMAAPTPPGSRSFRNRKLPRPAVKPSVRARGNTQQPEAARLRHGQATAVGRDASHVAQDSAVGPRGFARPRRPQYRRSPPAFPLGNRRPSAQGTADRPANRCGSRLCPTHRRSASACADRSRPPVARAARTPARRRAWPPPASDASEKFGFALSRLTPGIFPQTRLQG